MKYKEFREYIKLSKIHLEEDKESLIVDDHIEISKTEEHKIEFLEDVIRFSYELDLIKKVIELVETPLDEREEEIKYYLKHKFINKDTTLEYINLALTGKVEIKDRCEDPYYKTKFTKAEIEELKEKFDTDLKDFELIEVEV